MKIVIIGGGKVGYTLAQHLSTENHDVIVIDNNIKALDHIDETLDVMCMYGNGASVKLMREAGIREADLLIAVTDGDELNMVCCLIGKSLGAQHTVARIRNTEYSNEFNMLKEKLGLDMVINPEMDAASEIARIIRFPSASTIENFAHNMVEMVKLRITPKDPVINIQFKDLTKTLPSKILFCAVNRGDSITIPNGNFALLPDDVVYIIGERNDISKFFKYLGRSSQRAKNVTVVGGSRICIYLTWILSEIGIPVKIIEKNKDKCVILSEMLPKALVIHGDGTDQDLLDTENIQSVDAFVALTDRDEENLMSSIYAHQCGVPKVIPKINRLNYISIIKQLGMDSVISPKYTTANSILRYVRALENSQGSAVEKLYKILDDKAEVAEFTANESTTFLDVALRDLNTKDGIIIATIVRNKKIIIPYGNDCIKNKDKVIVVAKSGSLFDLNDIITH